MRMDIYFTVTRSPIKYPYHQVAIIDSLASGKSWWYCQLPVFFIWRMDLVLLETLSPVTIHCCGIIATN